MFFLQDDQRRVLDEPELRPLGAHRDTLPGVGLRRCATSEYDDGMTAAKIAITLAPEHLEKAKQAVRSGRAASVSAFIARALENQASEEALASLVHDLIEQHGAPTAKDRAWARRVVGKRRKRA